LGYFSDSGSLEQLSNCTLSGAHLVTYFYHYPVVGRDEMIDAAAEHYKPNSLATAHRIVRMETAHDAPR